MNRISDTANNGPRMPAIVFAVSGSKASAFDSANSKTSCVVVIANASDGLRSIAHPPTVHNAVMAPKAVNDDAFNVRSPFSFPNLSDDDLLVVAALIIIILSSSFAKIDVVVFCFGKEERILREEKDEEKDFEADA